MKMTMTHRQLKRLCQKILVNEIDHKVYEITDRILGRETLEDYSDDELQKALDWRAKQVQENRAQLRVVSGS